MLKYGTGYSILFALILMIMAQNMAHPVPKPGFVTVIGSAVPGSSHSDRGAPAPVQGIALKYSGADLGFCNNNNDGALNPMLASGKEIAANVYINQSEIQWYYNKGVRHFIFGNEPDGDPHTYASILKQAYPMFSALPGSVVIGGNCFGVSPYDTMYSLYNFKGSCDMVGFHNYSDDPATGLSMGSVVSLHNLMNNYGDGSKKIYLGEGWGPKRELRTCPRISPDIPVSVEEIMQMRGFVVNGWKNIITAQNGYNPDWVYGVLFFTLSDNWGFNYAHFYNGGLIDLYGNPKDDLLLLFPGNKLTVANCGFEHYYPGKPVGTAPFWNYMGGTDQSCYALDASIFRAGQRAQRLELSGTNEVYVYQTSESGSVTAGQPYTFSAWVKTIGVNTGTYTGARLGIKFYTSGGSQTSNTVWSNALTGDSNWTLLTVTATAPANSAKLRIFCDLQGVSGRAWFDDCGVSQTSSPVNGGIEGYVFNMSNSPISGAAVTVQPSGQSATTDSSGKFSISGLAAGAYEVSAVKSGYSKKTISRVVVAPNRTSVAGLHLPQAYSDRPCNVQAQSTGVSGVLRISWEKPSGGADSYRVYRSTSSGSLGSLVFNNVTDTSVWDEGLTDYQTYYYTVRRVLNGVTSSNTDNYKGIPTGGNNMLTYDTNASPDWSNNASQHGQTFVAGKTGGIVSATCVLANSTSPNYRSVTFSFLQGGPTGAQVGTSKTVTCYFNEIGTAIWGANEVQVVEGQTYYLKLSLNSSASLYRTNFDAVSGGRYYMNNQPYSANVDMWSSITIAESTAPDVFNVAVAKTGAGMAQITWETTAPTTGQIEYGPTASYGTTTPLISTRKARHEVNLIELEPGSYHFRIKATRPGVPDAYSADYILNVSSGKVMLSSIKQQIDGAVVGFSGIVSAVYQNWFYIEDVDRISGIRVQPAVVNVAEGSLVYVEGAVRTGVDGERYIDNATVLTT